MGDGAGRAEGSDEGVVFGDDVDEFLLGADTLLAAAFGGAIETGD